ncbi:HAD-IA family hydrolase [Desulfobacterales bacterium HSG16]|nr:HAD-IA family hydrolase [Desulfobacterales bacterium HSG16]
MKIQKPFRIYAVLFDFDGTLTRPHAFDWEKIKGIVGCPIEKPVLEFIQNMADPVDRQKAFGQLDAFEQECAAESMPNPGAEDIISYLKGNKIKTGIISRNSSISIETAMKNFKNLSLSDFDVVISRDAHVKPKPSPEGIFLAAEKLNVSPKNIMMVGDFFFDMQAGKQADSVTVFIDNGDKNENDPDENNPDAEDKDFTISRLDELKQIIKAGISLSPGKFPNSLLKDVLDKFTFYDPSVLIRPNVGEDIAAVDVKDEEVLVLKSDPITFATDAIGHYAVIVNANDISTSGATPRWFLTSWLFPPGTSGSEICCTIDELHSVCQKYEITLCGGHTEITDAVTRPVVTGMLVGTVTKKDLIDKKNLKKGDKILLTKGVAVEGTSIIAREFEKRLLDSGMDIKEIEICKNFLDKISVLEEAKIAALSGHVSAMHDVTEGGLATAIGEFSIAGGHEIRVNMDKIPVFPQTKKIGELLNIDPLGLIGSGSLLIACRSDGADSLIQSINNAGIDITQIGEVMDNGEGIAAIKNETQVQWPEFMVDEITRLF